MDKLYSELTLESVENQPSNTHFELIKDYKEMFIESPPHSDELNTSNNPKVNTDLKKVRTKRKKGKKILLKGDPGMGKATLMKKISWDWAKGFFIQFSIVFFIFLKLVQPGEPIENIIINQIPELEGMSVSPEKLEQILKVHSSRCLLIFDGLDEHALGQNEDVLKIIKGQKLLYCNIIVTARPHSTKKIERYFGMVVRTNGFNREQAENFASRVLVDRHKVRDVLQYSPSGWEYLYVCPIIFLIVCVLMKNEAIDLGSKSFCNGELYFKLVRYLYVKYTKQIG